MDGNEFGKFIIMGYDSVSTNLNKAISIIRSGGKSGFSDLRECIFFIKENIDPSQRGGVNITRNGYEGILKYEEIARAVEGKFSEDDLQALENKFKLTVHA